MKKANAKTGGLTAAAFKKIALSFPGASEKPSYGKPSIFIEKKFFTRLRKEDESLVIYIGSIDEREMLMEMDPDTYHLTEHYRDYPIVLVRLANINEAALRKMLERRWREIAPKKLQKTFEDAAPPKPAAGRRAKKAAGPTRRAR